MSIFSARSAAFAPTPTTCGFDVTGHPALSLPCAKSDGLPIGLQLVGKHFAEADIYRAAYAFEQSTDWKVPSRPRIN